MEEKKKKLSSLLQDFNTDNSSKHLGQPKSVADLGVECDTKAKFLDKTNQESQEKPME